MPLLKSGPLTRAELQKVWESAADTGYTRPFLEAGDGNGFEVWSQFFEQMARVSKAIDVTTQAMFIAPWSGQTNPPASGEAKSRVELTITRSRRVEFPLYLAAGQFLVAEETTDAGDNGPITVQTGRRYVLLEDAFFFPGDRGPLLVEAEAERPGYGYDNPLPGTISLVEQPASQFENDLAAVVSTTAPLAGLTFSSTVVTADAQADMFVPEHVGQQIRFVTGANQNLAARMIRFVPPEPSLFRGSGVEIELLATFAATTHSGTFEVGEEIRLSSSGPTLRSIGRVVAVSVVGSQERVALVIRQSTGTAIAAGYTALGMVSGATATILIVTHFLNPTSEAPIGGVGGASWEILDWVADYGVEVRNEESPTGGRSPMLDELGAERNIARFPGESDNSYRERIRELGDVVAPNAIKRTVARNFFFPWSFLEAGTSWRGFFYDGTNEPASATPGRALCDAYDTDVIVYAGTDGAGTFEVGEPVVVEDVSYLMTASGYAGRVSPTEFLLVRKTGSLPMPSGTFHVRGLWSGAIFDISSATRPSTAFDRRYRTYLDYERFRGFFWIEVANLGIGEFGFAYDAGPSNAYDVSAYDGFPAGAAVLYRGLWQAVNRARAEGVGFDLVRRAE